MAHCILLSMPSAIVRENVFCYIDFPAESMIRYITQRRDLIVKRRHFPPFKLSTCVDSRLREFFLEVDKVNLVKGKERPPNFKKVGDEKKNSKESDIR